MGFIIRLLCIFLAVFLILGVVSNISEIQLHEPNDNDIDTPSVEIPEIPSDETPENKNPLETKYGTIPDEFSNIDLYPIVVFDTDGNFVTVGDKFTDSLGVALNQPSPTFVIVRKNLGITKLWGLVKGIDSTASGTVTVDLMGNSIISNGVSMLFEAGGYTETKNLKITIKNGKFERVTAPILRISSLNTLKAPLNIDLAYDNVTFCYADVANGVTLINDDGYKGTGVFTTNVVLNDCMLDITNIGDNLTGSLFCLSNSVGANVGAINVTVNGGTIKASDFEGVTLATYDANDTVKFGKGSSGDYTNIVFTESQFETSVFVISMYDTVSDCKASFKLLEINSNELVLTPCEHTYDNSCDIDCNICGKEKTEAVEHDYSVKANDAGFHWLKCSYCGVVDNTSKVAHSYSYICDESCNDCSYTRDVTHDYTVENFDENGHWLECSVCGFDDFNSDEPHEYSDSSDETCNHCSYVRVITHVFDGDCDSYCNDCGDYRTTSAAHVYDGDCDSSCNICYEQRTTSASHVYDNSSDDICNVCGWTRPIQA